MQSPDGKVPLQDDPIPTTKVFQAPPPTYPMVSESVPQPAPQYVGTPSNITVANAGGVSAVILNGPPAGPHPMTTTCRSCNQPILTRIQRTTSSRTHIAAIILCCFGCWPCAWIPYVMDSCKNADHYCPNCGAYIGTYKN